MKILVGGFGKAKLYETVRRLAPDVTVEQTNDLQAYQELRNGRADYYFGSCASGGGSSLGALVGLLGYDKTATISRAGRPPKREEIEQAVRQGKIAFGMSVDHIDLAVPMLLDALRTARGG